MDIKEKHKRRIRRHKRVRAVIKGTEERPRLCVFRSNKHIYAQLIDDLRGVTILSASDIQDKILKKNLRKDLKGKIKVAYYIGELIAKKAKDKGISEVVFDRGGYKYHGRVKALAEGARKGGLKF